jgi:hypothetical protein
MQLACNVLCFTGRPIVLCTQLCVIFESDANSAAVSWLKPCTARVDTRSAACLGVTMLIMHLASDILNCCSGPPDGRYKLVCHPCQAGHHHAKGRCTGTPTARACGRHIVLLATAPASTPRPAPCHLSHIGWHCTLGWTASR